MINNINDFKKLNNTVKREKNLNLILDSNSYKLAQEDLNLLRSDEMRGVRMLLEITTVSYTHLTLPTILRV